MGGAEDHQLSFYDDVPTLQGAFTEATNRDLQTQMFARHGCEPRCTLWACG